MCLTHIKEKLPLVILGRIFIFILGVSILGGCGKSNDEKSDEAGKTPVQLSSLRRMTFNDSVRTQGTLVSKNFALVPARIGGTVEELFVDEGDDVEIDQPLCQIDREKLIQTVETRKQQLAVAESSLEVSQAQLVNIQAELKKASKDYKRFEQLRDDAAVTIDRFEQVETRKIGSEAADKIAAAQIKLAEARVNQARASLAIARRNLNDTTIRSPIKGTVSHRFYELGEMAKKDQPAFRVDDTNILEFSGYLSSSYYPRIAEGETPVQLRIAGEDIGRFFISYRSPTIDEKLRTFEIKCLISDPPPSLAPGMMADAEIILDSREGRGVPIGTPVRRGGEIVLFAVEGGVARAYPIIPGYSTNGIIEIISGLPETVDEVVTLGQKMLDNGDMVRILQEAR